MMENEQKDEKAGLPDEKKDKELVDSLTAKLEDQEQSKEKQTDEPRAGEAIPFDVGKLSAEQLQTLKSMLAVTPDRATSRKKNPTTSIRIIDGRYVVATKNTYLALVYDSNRLVEIETHKMPVKFHDADKFTDILYTDFMKADRVNCEILSIRQERSRKVEGEVVQRETGKLVEQEVIIVKYFFTIKLPDGTTVEVDDSASNA